MKLSRDDPARVGCVLRLVCGIIGALTILGLIHTIKYWLGVESEFEHIIGLIILVAFGYVSLRLAFTGNGRFLLEFFGQEVEQDEKSGPNEAGDIMAEASGPEIPRQPPDTMKYRPPIEQDIQSVKLWNPNAAGCWSVLFTPLFGSILAFINWRALGKDEEAKKAKLWIWISVLVVVALPIIPGAVIESLSDSAPFGVAGIFLLTWYFSLNKPQAKYFKHNLGSYKKRGWGKPLGLAMAGLVGYFLYVGAVSTIIEYQKGEFDSDIAELNKIIEASPRDFQAYKNRGLAWARKGDWDRASADFTQAIEIDPGNTSAYMLRAKVWEQRGDLDSAIADFSKALEIDPRPTDPDYNTYYWRGRTWDMKGDYDRAIADLNKALEIHPRHANACNVLAWISATCPDARYRDGAKAVELAQKAVELVPQYYGFLDTLAAAYAEAGRFDDAITAQEKVVALVKKDKTEELTEFIERLSSYKARKPWRDK